MARQRRSWVPGLGAHLVSRFVDREFRLVDEDDRKAFVRAMTLAHPRWDWDWLSYSLMSSHVHYGVLAGELNPDPFFRSVHTRFAHRYHRESAGTTLGPVFAARPKLWVVRRPMLIRLVAYHHRNPVEAGVVAHARDSNWTSHRIYLRLEPAPPFFDVERALSVLGFSDTEAGRRRFDDMVMDLDLSDWRPEKLVTKPVFTSEPATVEWRRLVAAALHVTGLSDAQLAKRCGKGVVARRLIATMAREDFGQTYQRIGEALGMSTGAVSNLLGRKSLDAALVDRARARYSELADAA